VTLKTAVKFMDDLPQLNLIIQRGRESNRQLSKCCEVSVVATRGKVCSSAGVIKEEWVNARGHGQNLGAIGPSDEGKVNKLEHASMIAKNDHWPINVD
jgi:hypothetical protein